MKKYITLLCLLFALSAFLAPVQAAKPEGKGKPDSPAAEKVEKAKEKAEEAKSKSRDDEEEEDDDRSAEAKEKSSKAKEKSNKSDKTDAERKEAGKGSQMGQEKREENSRKWWKFWE